MQVSVKTILGAGWEKLPLITFLVSQFVLWYHKFAKEALSNMNISKIEIILPLPLNWLVMSKVISAKTIEVIVSLHIEYSQ